jgi:ABC-2 type transport system ATP-binding protein
MAVIEVEGLRKEYGRGRHRTVALAGLDLDVPAGGVFGFLGPNGSGKTTTIRCLLALVRPTAGRCRLLGVDAQRELHRVQRRVGTLTEGQALFPSLSAHRNLALLARLYGPPAARVDQVLDLVGLADRAGDLVRTYSLGMRQRAGIAAALLKDPELLILDEPANGLDPAGIVEVRRLLRRLGDEGRTVFVSSHQLAEVQVLCDRVAVLARGTCVASGPIDEVLASMAGSGVVVRVPDVVAGAEALRDAGLRSHPDGDGGLLVDVSAADGALVAEALARHGIYASELRPAGTSLEDAFLALTRSDEAAS